jgi:pimeloyl-ACP methyl ester carboxylesterase
LSPWFDPDEQGLSRIGKAIPGYGTTRFLSSDTFRSAQQSVVALDIINIMDALKVGKAIIGDFYWGGRFADTIAALWPERCKALALVSGYLISSPEANKRPLPPKAELEWRHGYDFATGRGRAGYEEYRRHFRCPRRREHLCWTPSSSKAKAIASRSQGFSALHGGERVELSATNITIQQVSYGDTEPVIFGSPLREAIETFGYDFFEKTDEGWEYPDGLAVNSASTLPRETVELEFNRCARSASPGAAFRQRRSGHFFRHTYSRAIITTSRRRSSDPRPNSDRRKVRLIRFDTARLMRLTVEIRFLSHA